MKFSGCFMKLFRLFNFCMKRPEDFARTLFNAGFFALRSIGQTFFMINDNQIVYHADRTGWAGFNAHLTGNAPHFAETPHRFSGIMGAAGNPDPSL